MPDIKRRLWSVVAMFAFTGLVGCATSETMVSTQALSVAVASTGSVAVSVSSETATVTQSSEQTHSPTAAVDILKDAKKPCGTVAADTPKFAEPEKK